MAGLPDRFFHLHLSAPRTPPTGPLVPALGFAAGRSGSLGGCLAFPTDIHTGAGCARSSSSSTCLREDETDVSTRLQHTATPAELAAASHVSEKRALAGLQVNQSHTHRPASLDKPLAEGTPGLTLLDLIGASDPALRQAEAQITVSALLARLPERERRILTILLRRYRSARRPAGQHAVHGGDALVQRRCPPPRRHPVA